MVGSISRRAAALPDISKPTSKPSSMPRSRIASSRDWCAMLMALLAPIWAARSSRNWLTSVITMWRAPTNRAVATAMMPMGPAPVMSTSSPTTLKASAVCVALPNGSRIEATSSSMAGESLKTLAAGSVRYSANAPGRFTPTPNVLRHRCRRPARQLRQCPQVMCPSPDTRSPALTPRTSLPTSTISPEYSWPTAIGTGMVFCAQASQLKMCMSVPQIAERRILMRTSLWPTAGSGTSCIQIPGSARALTNAFMSLPSMNDAERAPGARERRHHAVELRGRMRRAHLSADPRFAVGHDRIRECDHVNAVILHAFGELHGERRLAEHDRNDGVLARKQIETEALHLFAEIAGIGMYAIAQRLGAFQQIQNLQGRRRDRRGDAVGEQVRPRALAPPADDLLAGRDIAAARTAECLAEGSRQDVDPIHHAS